MSAYGQVRDPAGSIDHLAPKLSSIGAREYGCHTLSGDVRFGECLALELKGGHS